MQSLTDEEIETLKAAYPRDTRALVKAVAPRMFAAGERPTRAAVYALIRRGSMTTIDAALREWWDELRRQTHAQMKIPEIPEALIEPFQAAIKAMWDAAHGEAKAAFEEDRVAAATSVAEAKEEADAALALIEEHKGRAREAQAAKERVQEELAAVRTALDAETEKTTALLSTRARLESELDAVRAARERDAQTASDVQAAMLAERTREREALEGQLAFATRQIDEAREKTRAVTSDLERERRLAEKAANQARSDLDAVTTALNETRSNAMQLEKAVSTERERAAIASAQLTELRGERERLTNANDSLAASVRGLTDDRRSQETARRNERGRVTAVLTALLDEDVQGDRKASADARRRAEALLLALAGTE